MLVPLSYKYLFITLSHFSTAVSSIIGSLLTSGGKALVGTLIKLIPGVGTALGGLISGSVGAIITAAFGEATSKVAYETTKAKLKGEDIQGLMNNFGTQVTELAKDYFKQGKKIDDYTL